MVLDVTHEAKGTWVGRLIRATTIAKRFGNGYVRLS